MPRRKCLDVPGAGHRAPIPMAVRVGNMIFTSAIAGRDPSTGQLPPDPGVQTALAFDHLKTILEQGGSGPEDLAHVSVLIADESLRAYVDQQWVAMFPDASDRPARHSTVTALRGGAVVQLEAIAVLENL